MKHPPALHWHLKFGMPLLALLAALQSFNSPVLLCGTARRCAACAASAVSFVNPLDIDGFVEPGGWGTVSEHEGAPLPLLCFLPGMDGSLSTAFMQYPELGTCFELQCMQHAGGRDSRASFDELVASAAEHVASASAERKVLLVGESFGASLAIAVAHRLQEEHHRANLLGLVLVNPATSYERSALATIGPACARLTGVLYPLYPLSLLLLAQLVLTPRTQAPPMLSMLLSQKIPSILCSPHREAFLGRVALSAFLGRRGAGLSIGEVLKIDVFKPEDLDFRLRAWLQPGAAHANALLETLRVPTMAIVGDADRLLPSAEEANRLAAAVGPAMWRGIVVVPGAGHASTLGNRLNLLDEIRHGFAQDGILLRSKDETPNLPMGDMSEGIWRGMLDRPFPPLNPDEYTRWNNGDLARDLRSRLGR